MHAFGEWVISGGGESSLSSSADVEAVVAFKVAVGGDRLVAKHAVAYEVAVDRALAASGDLHELVRVAALHDLEGRLAAGTFGDTDETQEFVRFFGTQDADYLAALVAEAKQCLWMIDTEPRGHDCGANHVFSGPQTSLPICLGCDLPDTRLICDDLTHPMVGFDPVSKGTRRKLLSAMCDAGQEIGLGGDCRPGGKGCWRRRGTQAVLLPAVEADVARKLVDEVDHLCRVYREFYGDGGASLWPPAGWRSIAELAGSCSSAPEFERQITNLACILASLNPLPQLSTERTTYSSSGKTVGMQRRWHESSRMITRGERPALRAPCATYSALETTASPSTSTERNSQRSWGRWAWLPTLRPALTFNMRGTRSSRQSGHMSAISERPSSSLSSSVQSRYR